MHCEPFPLLRTRGQRLLKLVGLVGVSHAEGVEVAAAADLELGHITSLLDLNRPGVLPAGGKEELLDLLNLLGLQEHKIGEKLGQKTSAK